MNCDVDEATANLENELCSFSNISVTSPTSQLILQPFRCVTYVIVHSPTLLSLLLRYKLFTILQHFRHFTYATTHSPNLPSLYLRHSSFSNPSFASPTPQAIHHSPTFRDFTYTTIHSPTLPSLHLRHNSFSNPSVALPTSLLILQPFRCFTYVTVHSPTLLSLLLRHKLFTELTCSAHSPNFPLLHLRHNPSVASPTSQFILQPFFCFSYVTSSSLSSPGEPPMD